MKRATIEKIAAAVGATPQDVMSALQALGTTWPKGKLSGQEVVALVAAMLAFRDASDGAIAAGVEGPEDWQHYSRRILSRFEDTRDEIRTVFGLSDEPLSDWRLVGPLVRDMAEQQPEVGRAAVLAYPDEVNGERVVRPMRVFEGKPTGNLTMPQAPLWRLLKAAERVSGETGAGQADTVSWLLAGEDIALPWIKCGVTYRSNGVHTYTLTIGSKAVRGDELADFWERVRQDPAAGVYQDAPDSKTAEAMRKALKEYPEKFTRSRQTGRVALMVAYVDAWKRKHPEERVPWQTLSRTFSDAYPDVRPFDKPESMRGQYNRVKRDEKKGGK